MLKIITFRDPESPILFKPSKKIKVFDAEIKKLVRKMKEALVANDGVGLAAPQINEGVAICLVKTGKKIQCFCNPKIVWSSKEQIKLEEGCLSFPEVFLEVIRPKEIEIVYQDQKGKVKKLKASGLDARALQHEIDHLNGVSFIERS